MRPWGTCRFHLQSRRGHHAQSERAGSECLKAIVLHWSVQDTVRRCCPAVAAALMCGLQARRNSRGLLAMVVAVGRRAHALGNGTAHFILTAILIISASHLTLSNDCVTAHARRQASDYCAAQIREPKSVVRTIAAGWTQPPHWARSLVPRVLRLGWEGRVACPGEPLGPLGAQTETAVGLSQ
jgi:hypothetical protein